MFLPPEWLENSIETYLHRQTTPSQRIYWVVLAVVLLALVSLPFIYIDISVQDSGVVRPVTEKTEVKAPITELVEAVYIREGVTVNKGDVILTFRTSPSDYKIAYQTNLLNDYESHLADLVYLAKGEKPPVFSSPTRRQQYTYYTQRHIELNASVTQAERDYNRNQSLFEKKVISEEEYDKYYYQYESRKNELASFAESQLSTWQSDLNTYRNFRDEMNAAMQQEVKDKDLRIVQSPVTGTVDQFSGIYPGNSVQAGELLAVISPDSTLCFEVYVSPRNIGYIEVGMPVNVQVSSFNYNEWGTIGGKVREISSDFLTDSQGNAYYKVKCDMEKDYLTLKRTGRKGKLKKGMAISAHFMITRRSLFHLLYQRLDDWINPTRYGENPLLDEGQNH